MINDNIINEIEETEKRVIRVRTKCREYQNPSIRLRYVLLKKEGLNEELMTNLAERKKQYAIDRDYFICGKIGEENGR